MNFNDKVYITDVLGRLFKGFGIIITKEYEKEKKEEEDRKRIEAEKRKKAMEMGIKYKKKYKKLKNTAAIEKNELDKVYIRLNNKILDDQFETQYKCYQDNTILQKTECIDTVDKTGKSKPSYNVY